MATVLVVDDDQPIVDLLMEVVVDAGHTAIFARNGRDALDLARQHNPPLIISDIRMPVMDGYGLLSTLRADPQLAETMVVLISAHMNAPTIPLDSTTAFVPKPLDLGKIEEFLQQIG